VEELIVTLERYMVIMPCGLLLHLEADRRTSPGSAGSKKMRARCTNRLADKTALKSNQIERIKNVGRNEVSFRHTLKFCFDFRQLCR
jgi:hypothetical protein